TGAEIEHTLAWTDARLAKESLGAWCNKRSLSNQTIVLGFRVAERILAGMFFQFAICGSCFHRPSPCTAVLLLRTPSCRGETFSGTASFQLTSLNSPSKNTQAMAPARQMPAVIPIATWKCPVQSTVNPVSAGQITPARL